MQTSGSEIKKILKFEEGLLVQKDDIIVIEQALSIVLRQNGKLFPLLITMRTPVDDFEMVLGYLFSEGIIKNVKQVLNIRFFPGKTEDSDNLDKIIVDLSEEVELDEIHDSFISFSSCGLCGKSKLALEYPIIYPQNSNIINAEFIKNIISNFSKNQSIFQKTGGLHAAAFYDLKGELVSLKEDIGRHNALDKIIGKALKANKLPAADYILLLSSRISYEMVAKCIASGISIVCGLGPASSLSIELAEEHNITLIGFVKKSSFNIYSGFERFKTN